MSDLIRMYATWKMEKAKLIAQLKANPNQVEKVVDDWFKSSVFEFGMSHAISRWELERLNPEEEPRFRKYIRQRLAYSIGEKLIETPGFYSEIITNGRDYQTHVVTVLVLGAPKFVRDNATGELKYVRD